MWKCEKNAYVCGKRCMCTNIVDNVDKFIIKINNQIYPKFFLGVKKENQHKKHWKIGIFVF